MRITSFGQGTDDVHGTSHWFEDKCKKGELTTDELIDLRDKLEIEYSKAAQFLKEQIKISEQEGELSD